NASHREKSGINGGDAIHVELSVATSPREVDLSEDFAEALKLSGTKEFFESLANSLQRYHCDLINGAKSDETRQRRIDKAISLFKQGKKR
ncbi:YdeI/OmpD-associated family protein, partial [candidate division WWE3 bacterium]|nr:YdeI/OmpD-associated family protein [candidate division WWE3 bacterium]